MSVWLISGIEGSFDERDLVNVTSFKEYLARAAQGNMPDSSIFNGIGFGIREWLPYQLLSSCLISMFR